MPIIEEDVERFFKKEFILDSIRNTLTDEHEFIFERIKKEYKTPSYK